tara:strand:+ start:268 stop:1188 length:921 start_codon:yes stop_codon:yes gene_type:complete
MFNRTLNRPMFRRGGRAGGGIMTGVQRQGYAGEGDASDQSVKQLGGDVDFLKEAIGERPEIKPYPYKASDFFMGLGANILAQPGGQPIFQTIGKAGIDPLNVLSQQNMSEYGLKQKNELGKYEDKKDIVMQAYKNMSQDEKNKLYTEATARFNNKGINPRTGEPYASVEEAYADLIRKDLMSKEKVLTPEAQYNMKYEELFSYYLNKDRNFKGNAIGAAALAKHEANILMNKYPEDLLPNFDNNLSYFDNVYVDDKGDGTFEINDIGANIGYRKGKIYFNISEQKLYRLGSDGKTFTEVDIADFED